MISPVNTEAEVPTPVWSTKASQSDVPHMRPTLLAANPAMVPINNGIMPPVPCTILHIRNLYLAIRDH